MTIEMEELEARIEQATSVFDLEQLRSQVEEHATPPFVLLNFLRKMAQAEKEEKEKAQAEKEEALEKVQAEKEEKEKAQAEKEEALEKVQAEKEEKEKAQAEKEEALEKAQTEKEEKQAEKAKRNGTYYEDADKLWTAGLFMLTKQGRDRQQQLKFLNQLFDNIARPTCPPCYNNFKEVYALRPEGTLPEFHDASVGTNSQVQNQAPDILGNTFSQERAHNAPDSPTCLPSWGHAAEGVLGKVEGTKQKMQKRILLVMGTKKKAGKNGFRYSPFNCIRFSNHAPFYDKAPHVLFLPIMTVDQIKGWNGDPYSVLLIVCDYAGQMASTVYSRILCTENPDEGTPDDIEIATESLRAFMKGLAASLLLNVPIDLAEIANTGKEEDLRAVKKVIKTNGLRLPFVDKNRTIRPVCKLHFDSQDSVADPWMLLAKASVNLSWKYGQKLLPACKPPAPTEGDRIFWQNMAEFQMAQDASVVPPAEVAVPLPQTPPCSVGVAEGVAVASREGVAVVTPEKEDENWEYLI